MILLIGETGSGKTTMINSLINFLNDIGLNNNFRYILIDESDEESKSKSKTSFITIYDIDSINNNYPSITSLIHLDLLILEENILIKKYLKW